LIGASLSMTYFAVRRSLGAFDLGLLADTLIGVLPFVLTCAALTLLYGVVPARRVEWRHALLGGCSPASVSRSRSAASAFISARCRPTR